MRKLLAPLLLAATAAAQAATPVAHPSASVRVRLETTDGAIVLQLDRAKAPITVDNFLSYVRDGHYDGTIFHRVIPGFVIQGGGYDTAYAERPTRAPIRNESRNGLSNLRGTIAMARTEDPDSATDQFYINLADTNARLDTLGGGYTVFGRVIEGMDVVDRIAQIPTGPGGPFDRDVPARNAIVRHAMVMDDATAKAKPHP